MLNFNELNKAAVMTSSATALDALLGEVRSLLIDANDYSKKGGSKSASKQTNQFIAKGKFELAANLLSVARKAFPNDGGYIDGFVGEAFEFIEFCNKNR